jgi:MFS family permease
VNANPRERPGGVVTRLATPRLAVGFGCLYLALLVAVLPLSALADQFTVGSVSLLIFVPFAAVGVLVAFRQPRNPIGWIMLLLALCFMVGADASFYSVAAYRVGRHELPLARLAVFLTAGWIGFLLLLPLPILLFPDGHLPSPRWRWTLRLYLVCAAVVIVTLGIAERGAFTHRQITVDSSGALAHTSSKSGLTAALTAALFIAYALLSLAWVARQVVAYRRSAGERREQLKWLMSGGATAIVCLVISAALNGSGSPVLSALEGIVTVGIAALPIGIGVGILKYRLYEIDRLISRTLSYAILTGLLVGVFVGIVALATQVLPFSSPVGVAASTLAAAALFNPLRGRVQHLVDRRFNRARYDAEAIVTAFTLRLRDAVDLDTVRGELLAAVDNAVQPAHVSIWLRPPASRLGS